MNPESASGDPDTVEDSGKPQQASPDWLQEMMGEGDFDLWNAVGGIRGCIEALLPGLLFVVVHLVSNQNLALTLAVSAACSVLFCVARAIQKSSLTQAFVGLAGVAIGVVWAAMSGKAENYYASSLIVTAIYVLILLASIVVRYPLGAYIAKVLLRLPAKWRKMSEFRRFYRRCTAVTWVWTGMFAIRLLVAVPLYYAGHVIALGTAKLVLGLPLFGVCAWLTWILLRGLIGPARKMAAKVAGETDSIREN